MGKTKSKNICSFVIMAFIFSLPLSTSASNILAILIILLWGIDRCFKEKFEEIKQNKVAIAVLAYIGLHVVGLLWTADMSQGLMAFKSQWKILLLPIIMNMADKNHTRFYIFSFFIAMTMSVSCSYLVWLNLITIKHASLQNPTPFMSHIVYGPFLALAIYISVHEILFSSLGKIYKSILAFIGCAMTVNMGMILGRTGYAAFLFFLVLLPCQYYRKQYSKAIVGTLLILITFSGTAYLFSPIVNTRVNRTYAEFVDTKFADSQTSLDRQQSPDPRLVYWWNTIKIIQKNLIIGVGTGDFSQEYRNLIQSYNYDETVHRFYRDETDNPHNQYLRVMSQFGIVGLLIFLSIFYTQIRCPFRSKDNYANLRIAFPLFYLVIFIGESYLQVNATTLLFSSFGGFLFKNPEVTHTIKK